MQTIQEMIKNTRNNKEPKPRREMKDDEYLGGNGLYYCKKCNTPRQFEWVSIVDCLCECQAQVQQNELHRQKINEMKRKSLINERYFNVSFDNTETGFNESFDFAFMRCKKYVEVAPEVLKRGHGIYIWGDKGTGKTHLTSCMLNGLIEAGYNCLLTNFFEISKTIRSTFNYKNSYTEEAFLRELASIDFLFIDDLGTELVHKNGDDTFLQEKVFEVINMRYNALKPTIFTSNHSLNALINERGFMPKTVDRIFEMTKSAVIKIEGASYRHRHVDALF